MRGKNILMLSLVAMMLTIMTVGMNTTIAAPAPSTNLFLTPDRLPEAPGTLAHAGDSWVMSVNIEDAVNLWAVQFKVSHAPYVSVTGVSEIYEGDFMDEGGSHTTFFTYTTDIFEGSFTAVILRVGPKPRVGVSGDGVLATFRLTVLEVGETPIEISDVILLDPEGNQLPATTDGSFLHGALSRLIRVNLPDGRKIKAGTDFTIASKIQNKGDIPMTVRVRLDIVREEDDRTIRIYSGQTYTGGGLGEPRPFEYLYVDEFNEVYQEWDGSASDVFGEPDGNYIEAQDHALWSLEYSFEDITLGAREIAEITLEGYTQYPNGASEAADIDIYRVWMFQWWGSLYGSPSWGWSGVRWTSDSVLATSPDLADETALNDVIVLIYSYHATPTDIMRLDSMRLKVEFASIVPVAIPDYEVDPYPAELELGPITWLSNEDHIGTYRWTATVEYTTGFKWNSWGSVQKTGFFWIVP